MKTLSMFTVAIATAALSVPTAVYAAPVNTPSLTYVAFAKEKTVKFSLRNDSGQSMELKVGDQMMTLDAGKSVALNLPIGTKILTNTATAQHDAGSLVAQVSNDLKDVTIAIR